MKTRQDAYQIRKLRAGLCVKCGKEPLVTAVLGERCRMKMKMRTAKWRMKRQEGQYKSK